MSNQLARRARIKDLPNKAEGIFQYVGNDNVLFRLISTGNKLTSDVNYAVALFTGFARSHLLGSQETRRTIDSIYRRVGELMCLIDIVHAAAGEEIMPEPYESIDFCYTKMIVGGGIINGSVALVFDDEVERYRKAGCDFSSCTTDEDYLAAIEAFEDNPPVADAGVSDQTRIADALEDMVALSLPDAE